MSVKLMTSKKDKRSDILNAALFLFNTKGYDGTSLRDIAKMAKVNVAHISYYYHSKQGLLEHCFSLYFDSYLEIIEKGEREISEENHCDILKEIIQNIIHFHCENLSLTRFILREMSIDSTVVREIQSTYLMKERYLFNTILETGVKAGLFKLHPISYLVIQLKSIITMPFLNTHYLSEIWQLYPQEAYFSQAYANEIVYWLEAHLFEATTVPSHS